jgi:hypothetical protein
MTDVRAYEDTYELSFTGDLGRPYAGMPPTIAHFGLPP